MQVLGCVLLTVCMLWLQRTQAAGYGSSSNQQGGSPKKYRVVSLVAPPFLEAADEDGKNSGFIIDMLDAMKGPTFDYTLTVPESAQGLYGDVSVNGSSTGLIGEIVNNRADIIASDMDQTHNRTLKVDFCQPYLFEEIRIAVNKDYNPDTATYLIQGISVAVQTFLEKSEFPLAQKIFAQFRAGGESNTVATIAEGIEKVAQGGNFAVVGETPVIQLEAAKYPGKVFFTSDNLALMWAAFAVRPASPEREVVDQQILRIRENSILQDLIDKYFPSVCS